MVFLRFSYGNPTPLNVPVLDRENSGQELLESLQGCWQNVPRTEICSPAPWESMDFSGWWFGTFFDFPIYWIILGIIID